MKNEDINNKEENNDLMRDESLSNLLDRTDVEKLIFSQKINLNTEKNRHLGLADENILFEYTFEQLNSKNELEDLITDLKTKDNIERVLINGDLQQDELTNLIEILSKMNLPFTIVKDPEFKGSMGVEVEKK